MATKKIKDLTPAPTIYGTDVMILESATETHYVPILKMQQSFNVHVHNNKSVLDNLGIFSASKDGLVPKTATGTTKYLRQDGTWQVPPNTTYTGANLKLTGYAKGDSAAAIAETDSVNAAIAKLENRADEVNTNIANKIIVGSTKNAMLVLTQPTLTFAAGVATYNATETANTYGKSVLGATAQLKSGSGVVITSTAIAGSTVTIRCANLSGTPFVGSIAVAVQLFLG